MYCSQIWPYAKNKVKTYKLDSLQIKPDLIKIHTEGTELDVLMGAKKNNNKLQSILSVFSLS